MSQAELTRVLGEALHLLTQPLPDFQRLVRAVGEMLEAETIQLTLFEERQYQVMGVREHAGDEVEVFSWWRGPGPEGAVEYQQHSINEALQRSGELPGLLTAGSEFDHNRIVLPILSSDDSFFGYFLIARLPSAPFTSEERRTLDVMAGMMSSTLRYRSMQQMLDANQQRWQQLVHAHPEPLLIFGDNSIQYANPAGLRFLQVESADELAALSLEHLIPRHYNGGLGLRRSLTSGATVAPTEVVIQLPGGEARTARISAVPLTLNPPSAFLVVRDVSEEIRSQERRRIFVETIAEGVACLSLSTPIRVRAAMGTRVHHLLRETRFRETNPQFRRMMTRLGLTDDFRALPSAVRALLRTLARDFLSDGHRLQGYPITVRDEEGKKLHLVIYAMGLVSEGALHEIWVSAKDVTERVENERRTMAMLEEQQQSVGRDLHDGVGQLLTGIRLLGQSLLGRLEEEKSPHVGLARQLATYAQEATAHVRAVYHGLAPVGLDEEGIDGALRALASSVSMGMGLTCQFTSDGKCLISDHMSRLHLYRIAQEAVNNALKHARARHIEIDLRCEGDTLHLRVRDDGQGFEPSRAGKQSLGLSSMRYRAQALSGRLIITSEPGSGTEVVCEMPMH